MIIGQESGTRFNMTNVNSLKTWLRECGFAHSSLFMFRENDRNAVFLRIRIADASADIEIAWLDSLRRERAELNAIRERIRERFDLTQEPAVA